MPKIQPETRSKMEERIEEAARNLFVQQGYASTTTHDIARAAGITPGSLYTHYKNKEALFVAVVQAYRDDPLVFHGTPPASRRAAMTELSDAMPGRVRSISLPVLIMAGSASPLGDEEGSRQLYEQVSSDDKTLKLYDGLMHEIFNEPEREHVFADLLAWLETDHSSA